jgi:L-ascorbate metabolism protein UlaG (beta-lactamase superfamily)
MQDCKKFAILGTNQGVIYMEITYFGQSAFKLRGKNGTVVTDPFSNQVGFSLPGVSADVVTVSHDHYDHNATSQLKGTARRSQPFIISYPGEYEVGGISVFGTPAYHDDTRGSERGENTVVTIVMEEVKICHLGDLGHELTNEQLEELGEIDVLICPVGGKFTIDPKTAVKVIQQIEPYYVIPMHYKTARHNPEHFAEMQPIDAFLKEYGSSPAPVAKLSVEKNKMPEETELVVLDILTNDKEK